MIKIKNYSVSQLVDYLSSYSQLQLKLNINQIKGQENSYLQAIKNALDNLIHLQELEILVKKNCILFKQGYVLMASSIQKLVNLTKLNIKIESLCYLDNSGFIALANSISHLSHLKELVLFIGINNYINSQAIKYFISSIKGLTNLTKIQLIFEDITKNIDEENISVWKELLHLQSLEEFYFSLNFDNFGDKDFLELFDQIILLKNLQKLQILLNMNDSGSYWIDKFIYMLSQLQKLKILIIDFDIDQQLLLNNSQIKQLYSNISGLENLQELQLISLQDQLLTNDAENYLKFIGGLKNLTKFQLTMKENFIQTKDHQIYLGECLKQLPNLKELDLTLGNVKYRFYDEFMIDLSEAIQNMSNLNILNLNLISYISQFGYRKLGESLAHLNKLESFKFIFQSQKQAIDQSLLLFNIRFLTQLKHLTIQIYDKTEHFDSALLFGSMEYLINLESLNLQHGQTLNGRLKGFQNINIITSLLKNLTKLSILQLNILIENQNDQKSIEEFIEAFQRLKNLNQLTISFQTTYQLEQEFEIINCLKHLENLKILQIYINIKDNNNVDSLANSISYLKNLESLNIEIFQNIDSLGLIQILSALKQSTKLKFLHLQIILDLINLQNEQLSTDNFHLQHLQQLIIEDQNSIYSKKDPLIFYSSWIKEFMNLTKLSITSKQGELTDIGALKLAQALQNKQNLRILNLELNCASQITQKGERLLSQVINQLKNLKKIKFQIENQRMIGNQIFDSSLGLDKLNKIYICSKQKGNKSEDELENNDSQNENTADKELMDLQENNLIEDKLNKNFSQVTDIFLDFKTNSKNFDFLTSFNHKFSKISNLKYLNRLGLKIESLQLNQQPLNLDLLSDFSKLNRLNVLNLNIKNIIIEKNTIQYIKEGFKHTQNIEYLYLEILNSFDSDYLLMQGISYLKNLYTLELAISLSDKGAESLGKSLSTFKNLKKCSIKFFKNDNFSQEGVVSIENGLKNLNNLRKLDLKLSELTTTNVYDIQTRQLGKFLTNMKHLDTLNIQIGGNNYRNSFGGIEIMKSLNQLQSLIQLSIKIDENNQITSENVGDFLEQLFELKNLKEMNIQIIQQSNQIVLKSKFAIIFNQGSQNETLKIHFFENFICFKQMDYDITIQYFQKNEMKIVDCEFFKSINENIPIELVVSFNFSSESQLYNCLQQLKSTQINIRFSLSIHQETYLSFCDTISYWQNAQILKLQIQFSFSNQDNKIFNVIAERISELKLLKILKLSVFSGRAQNLDLYINLINILCKLKQLQEIAINSRNLVINHKLLPLLKKKFKKLIALGIVYLYSNW